MPWDIAVMAKAFNHWRMLHTTAKCGKAKTGAEHRWLARQLKDPFVKAAHEQNYRCRSAFKLLEIDKKHHILCPGHIVVDCGAAPGAWSQVAVQRVNSAGLDSNASVGFVVGVDLQRITPLDGAFFLSNADITDPATQDKIKDILPWGMADVILSDMAPNATGVRDLDHRKIVGMCLTLVDLAHSILRPGGTLLCKLWDGSESTVLRNKLVQCFSSVKTLKPQASRKESSETFYLASFYQEQKGTLEN
ncbi:rRNA methyltransferase 2, mitochondrial-like isoform X2 [Pleurodeles waltl]|uniref:rRNA methyltransferase 2, mitochondrial-like isoform X2 n=1 Tax=Pleurodeles waltl TaxID=8319 RepID=UPI0037098F43